MILIKIRHLSLKLVLILTDANKIDLSHTIIDSESEYDGYDARLIQMIKSYRKVNFQK